LGFSFFYFIVFFFLRYWKKQLSISYIDYGDACLLYQASLFKNGLIIYKDFFAPQPPIIYLFWRLILKIFNNPISIRYFLVVLFLVSDFITFYIIFKFLKNKIISLLTIICSHIFFATIYWWPTFTGETFLRFFLVLFLFFFFPLKK
jgi:hypothetical protein